MKKKIAILLSSSIAKNASGYFGTTIILQLMRFITSPIIARFITTEEFGALSIVTTATSFLAIFFTMGMETVAIRKFYQYEGREYWKFVRLICGFILCANLLLCFAVFVIAMIYPQIFSMCFGFGFDDYGVYVLAAALYAPYYSIGCAILQARRLVRSFSKIQIAKAGFSVVPIILLAFLGLLRIKNLLLLDIVSGTLFSVITLKIAMGRLNTNIEIVNRDDIRLFDSVRTKIAIIINSLKYGFPFVPQNIFNWLNASIDRLILMRMIVLADFGIYMFGITIGAIGNMIISAINTAYVPFFLELAAKDERRAKNNHRKIMQLYLVGTGVVFVTICFLSREILFVVAGEKYLNSNPYFILTVVANFWMGIYLIYTMPLYFVNCTYVFIYLSAFSFVIYSVCGYFAAKYIGPIGIVALKFVCMIIMAYTGLALTKKKYNISYGKNSVIVVPMAMSALMIIPLFVTSFFLRIPALILIYVAIALILYFLNFYVRVFENDDTTFN
ncbi:MAG: oligosaccharide flippase family protein [Negativicutes bacterium]